MENKVGIYLETKLGEGDPTDPTEKMFKSIQEIRTNVYNLRNENLDLEKSRDQYIIHLQQCQEDKNILNSIMKHLKFKIDMLNVNRPQTSINQDILKSELPKTPETDPLPALTSNIPISEQQEAPLPKPQYQDLNYQIIPESNTSDGSKITLRYALDTSLNQRNQQPQYVITCVQISPNGKYVAFADSTYLYIINFEDGSPYTTISIPSGTQHRCCLKFSPDSSFIAFTNIHHEILLYSVSETPELIKALTDGHKDEISSLLFNKDGSWLISGGYDGILNIWSMETFSIIKQIPHSSLNEQNLSIVSMAIHPDDDFIAVGFTNGKVGIYGASFTDPMTSFVAHDKGLINISVSENGNICTTSGDETAKIWTLKSIASCKAKLEGHPIIGVFGNNIVLTGGKDGNIKIWNQKSGNLLYTIKAHTNTIFEIAHHPTEQSFVSSSGEGIICCWDYKNLV